MAGRNGKSTTFPKFHQLCPTEWVCPFSRTTSRGRASEHAPPLSCGRGFATSDAATLVEDQDLVTDYIRWFEKVLTARSLPLAFVPNAFDLLLGVLPAEVPRARDLALFGRDACTEATLDAAYGPENA